MFTYYNGKFPAQQQGKSRVIISANFYLKNNANTKIFPFFQHINKEMHRCFITHRIADIKFDTFGVNYQYIPD